MTLTGPIDNPANGVISRVVANRAAGATASAPVFTAAALNKESLMPAPINPDWVLDGDPQASCETLAEGTRGWGSTAHWACTAGTFKWHFGWDETVLFLEGAVTITDDTGTVYQGKPGVTLFFPAGTNAVWQVPAYIRKIAFNQKPIPWYLNKTSRIVERLQGLLGQMSPRGTGLGG